MANASDWFSQQGIAGFTPYEQGGITGGQPGNPLDAIQQTSDRQVAAAQQVALAAGGAQPAPAFDPSQSVGHDGTINGMNREQYRDAWQGSGVTNNAGMDQWLAQHGGRRLNDAGLVVTPFGEQLDMGEAFKTGNGKAAWGGVGGDGGSPEPIPVGSGQTPAAAAASGFSTAMSSTGVPAGGAGFSGHLNGTFAPFQYQAFDPASVSMSQDPGVAFRLKQGQQTLENSAAARGTLLSGATAKALVDYGQGAASQEYGNAFNRALGVNQANNAGNLGAFQANTNADLGYGNLALGNKSADNSFALGQGNLALGQGQLALGNRSADQSYDLGLRNNALGYTQAGNAFALGMGQQNLGWANYGLNADAQNFGQGFSLASLGQNSASNLGNAGQVFARNAGDYATNSGNSQAAAGVISANGYNDAFGKTIDAASKAYYNNQRQNG